MRHGHDCTPQIAEIGRGLDDIRPGNLQVFGRDAAAIEAVVGELPLQRHATLEAAVAWCFEQAQPGDAVLLSPACASLDMFRNYAHRAEVFVQTLQAMAHDLGEVS